MPQEQNRTLILPGDPQPLVNPRPSPDTTAAAPSSTVTAPNARSSNAIPTNPQNVGFSVYVLGVPAPLYGLYPSAEPFNPGPNETDEFGAPITDENGYAINLSTLAAGAYFPDGKQNVLPLVADMSGIATPPDFLFDRSTVIPTANVSVPLIAIDQPGRGFICLYNPTQSPVQIALGATAVWGALGNLPIGPGEAYFWSTAQGLGGCYQGQVSIICQTAGQQFWAWESPTPNGVITDDYGNIATDDYGHWATT